MNELEHRGAEQFLLRIAKRGFPRGIQFLEVAIRRNDTCQIRDEVEELFKSRDATRS